MEFFWSTAVGTLVRVWPFAGVCGRGGGGGKPVKHVDN